MLRDAEVVKLTPAAGDPRPVIVALNIRRIGVGTKVLSASIWIRRWRWMWHGVLLHRHGDREWIQLPGKEWVDGHGNRRCSAVGRFDSDAIQQTFRKLAIEAIKRAEGEM